MFKEKFLVGKEPSAPKAIKKIGLISDTHIPKRAHALPKSICEVFQEVDYIIHAGDLVELSVLDELKLIAPVIAVHGNMDGFDVKGFLPNLNSLKVFDWKIGVMHDPDIAFGFTKIKELVDKNGFDIFIYGHTHEASINWEGKTLYINPGSPTVPATIMNKLSIGLLKITKEAIVPQIVPLE